MRKVNQVAIKEMLMNFKMLMKLDFSGKIEIIQIEI